MVLLGPRCVQIPEDEALPGLGYHSKAQKPRCLLDEPGGKGASESPRTIHRDQTTRRRHMGMVEKLQSRLQLQDDDFLVTSLPPLTCSMPSQQKPRSPFWPLCPSHGPYPFPASRPTRRIPHLQPRPPPHLGCWWPCQLLSGRHLGRPQQPARWSWGDTQWGVWSVGERPFSIHPCPAWKTLHRLTSAESGASRPWS